MIVNYGSTVRRESAHHPGVTFVVHRMSFGRRIELMKTIRDASAKADFHAAAPQADKMLVGVLTAEIDHIYVRWGLREIEGLVIDGEPATPETLSTLGPENLFLEALTAVKEVCGLSEPEKKT